MQTFARLMARRGRPPRPDAPPVAEAAATPAPAHRLDAVDQIEADVLDAIDRVGGAVGTASGEVDAARGALAQIAAHMASTCSRTCCRRSWSRC